MIDHNVLLISYCISCLFFSSGPASSTFEMIEKLFLNGADVFRLNFSHGEHAQKKELLDIIRQVEAKHDHPIAVLGDLQGPTVRSKEETKQKQKNYIKTIYEQRKHKNKFT